MQEVYFSGNFEKSYLKKIPELCLIVVVLMFTNFEYFNNTVSF